MYVKNIFHYIKIQNFNLQFKTMEGVKEICLICNATIQDHEVSQRVLENGLKTLNPLNDEMA